MTLLSFLPGRDALDEAGRVARYDDVGFDIVRHHAAGSHYGVVTYRYFGQGPEIYGASGHRIPECRAEWC